MTASFSQDSRRARLKELDGWRAISVLLVIAHHLGAYQYHSTIAPHLRLAAMFNNIGPLGVRVFFVISGFVICRLLIQEEHRSGTISLKGFYIRRAFRILPPLYLYSAVVALLLSAGLIRETWPGIGSSMLFLYDIVPAKLGGWIVGHTWSLAVEEQFYLTFPAIWILARTPSRRRAVVLAAFVLFAAWNLCDASFDWNQLTNSNTRGGFSCICWGVVLASFEARARAVARKTPFLAVAAMALALLWHPAGYGSHSALFDSLYMPLAIGLTLLYSLERGPWLRALLCWKPMQAIGLTSYGIYLWQELFLAPFKYYTASGQLIGHLSPLLLILVPLSWLLVEKPAMNFGRSLANRVRTGAVREEVFT